MSMNVCSTGVIVSTLTETATNAIILILFCRKCRHPVQYLKKNRINFTAFAVSLFALFLDMTFDEGLREGLDPKRQSHLSSLVVLEFF